MPAAVALSHRANRRPRSEKSVATQTAMRMVLDLGAVELVAGSLVALLVVRHGFDHSGEQLVDVLTWLIRPASDDK
jgi:hypothetical protein